MIKKISSSWFMYYLGSKNEDGFVTTAIKLGYSLFTKKMDYNTTAIMWQESYISKKSQRIVLRYLLNFVGIMLVVPEYCIDNLGQNHLIPQCELFLSDGKTHFSTKYLTKILTTSLESLYCQECPNQSESNAISTIDIVVCGDHD